MKIYILETCGNNPVTFTDGGAAYKAAIQYVRETEYYANVYADGQQMLSVRMDGTSVQVCAYHYFDSGESNVDTSSVSALV